jgi:hypothetical protein|nr:PcfJ domain-containing protein [Neorhizobium tomejilense]
MTDQTRTDIAAAIAPVVGEREGGDDVLKLAVIGIGNVLYRHHRRGGDWRDMLSSHEADFQHVIDWIAAAVADKDEWLAKTDDKGRPLKLAKMHSLEQLKAEADKAFGKKLQKIGSTVLLPDDEALEMELADGYRVVRMLSPAALDRESGMMQHCVGLGSYDGHLRDNRRALYSLRDTFNKPHATMEVDVRERVLLQLRGKQNAMPTMRYLRMLGPFVRTMDFDRGELANRGFVVDSDGIVLHVSDIPDGTSFATSLRFGGLDDDDEVRVPSAIFVEGNLTLSHQVVDLLQRPATITGDVAACGMQIDGFHPDFVFGGSLNLEGSKVNAFPSLHIKGDLNLKETAGVRLQPGTVIEGSLNILLSDIRELPADLVVKGDILASRSALESIPEGLVIGGSLFLSGAKAITEISDGVRIGGNVLLRDSSVQAIGRKVSVGGMISLDSANAVGLRVEPDLVVGAGIFLRDVGKFAGLKSQMSVEEFIAAVAQTDGFSVAEQPRSAGARF